MDTTLAFSSGKNKQVAQCFQDIIKVGSIDTATVGCIASKVVLYVSLIFILSIVVIKFLLAILFQWFLCRKFAANKTSMGGEQKITTSRYEKTGRGGKGREVISRGTLTEVIYETPPAPEPFEGTAP